MSIQMYPDDWDYVNAKLKRANKNSFIYFFCNAALHADAQNYRLLQPALEVLKISAPALPEDLDAERRDRK